MSKDGGSRLKTSIGTITLAAVCGVLVPILCCVGVFLFWRRKQRQKKLAASAAMVGFSKASDRGRDLWQKPAVVGPVTSQAGVVEISGRAIDIPEMKGVGAGEIRPGREMRLASELPAAEALDFKRAQVKVVETRSTRGSEDKTVEKQSDGNILRGEWGLSPAAGEKKT